MFHIIAANFRGVMKECYHRSCDNKTMITPSNLEFLATTTGVITKVLLQRATELTDFKVLFQRGKSQPLEVTSLQVFSLIRTERGGGAVERGEGRG